MRKPSGITLKGLNISKGAGKLVRRKVDMRTVCIALEGDADASEKMHRTRRLYGQACDLLVPIVVSDTDRKDRLRQRYNLYKAAYPMLPPLRFFQSAISQATASRRAKRLWRPFPQDAPVIGYDDFASGSIQERDIEVLLKLRNAGTCSRLRQRQLDGGTRGTAKAHDERKRS